VHYIKAFISFHFNLIYLLYIFYFLMSVLQVRELSKDEMEAYQGAVRQLMARNGQDPSRWFQFAELYARHKPQAVGTSAFLPWHRKFLAEVSVITLEVEAYFFLYKE
jgi:hypothetical protein